MYNVSLIETQGRRKGRRKEGKRKGGKGKERKKNLRFLRTQDHKVSCTEIVRKHFAKRMKYDLGLEKWRRGRVS